MEAASYTPAWKRNGRLDETLDEGIAFYVDNEEEDGYFNQMYMLSADQPHSLEMKGSYSRELRFTGTVELRGKGIGQLYSAAHSLEAAAARYRATDKQNFLQIAINDGGRDLPGVSAGNLHSLCRAFPCRHRTDQALRSDRE